MHSDLAKNNSTASLQEPSYLNCRVCGKVAATKLGTVEYIADYPADIHYCTACGCQFTMHNAEIYDVLHSTGAVSYYRSYRSIAARCRSCFERNDIEGLRDVLSTSSKYRFIIERISTMPLRARLLEVGCSRGYLTAYAILAGRSVLGVDVSREAIEEARGAFGNHFAIAGDTRVAAGAPYDLVYHTGMIGCVADPVSLTHDLLKLLSPGGMLLFNAPNRDALYLRRQLWIDSAPPPDLVTLFPPGFFLRQFSAAAHVVESVEKLPAGPSMQIALRQMFDVKWTTPQSKPIDSAGISGLNWPQATTAAWQIFERIVTKMARLSGTDALIEAKPTEFGLFVALVRK